jgi:hypothetical protein
MTYIENQRKFLLKLDLLEFFDEEKKMSFKLFLTTQF